VVPVVGDPIDVLVRSIVPDEGFLEECPEILLALFDRADAPVAAVLCHDGTGSGSLWILASKRQGNRDRDTQHSYE
jgi:hypothetical protein